MARTEAVWQEIAGSYLTTQWAQGRDILINGTNKYLNFGSLSGSSGYGFRDNAGTMEYKNSGGAWAAITGGGGGGGITPTIPTGAVDTVNKSFVVSGIPQYIVSDTSTYFEGHGYTRSGLNITMDLAPTDFIRAFI